MAIGGGMELRGKEGRREGGVKRSGFDYLGRVCCYGRVREGVRGCSVFSCHPDIQNHSIKGKDVAASVFGGS